MSKKKDRCWFICPQWEEMVSQYYPDDEAGSRALRTNLKVLVQLRQRTPIARSTTLKMLRRFASLHAIGTPIDKLIVDTRSH